MRAVLCGCQDAIAILHESHQFDSIALERRTANLKYVGLAIEDDRPQLLAEASEN